MTDAELRIIPWDAILSTKSVAYHALTDPDKVRDLLPPDLGELDRVLAARRERFADRGYRSRLVEELRRMNQRLSAPGSAVKSTDRLQDPESFLVVAGQQAGLLTGPLYTVYKAATAIALARRLNEERKETFIPCFWCASEDHDFAEIASLVVSGTNAAPRGFRMPNPDETDRPIYELPPETCPLEELRRFLEESLRSTEFTPGILELVEQTYRSSKSLSEWMARVLWALFPDDGLVIVLPEDGFYQREAVAILAAEIEHPIPSVEAVREAGEELERRGLEAQIHKAEGRSSFFITSLEGGRRHRKALFFDNGKYTDGDRDFSSHDLSRLLESDPLAISAGAALRPVCQDAALPVAVAILGPGEVNYYAQIGRIYDLHHVPRPAYRFRLSATLTPSRLRKIMDETGFGFGEFARDAQWLVREATRRSGPHAATEALETLRGQVAEAFEVLKQEAERLDPTIVGALGKDRKGIEKTIDRVESLLNRRRADKEKTLQSRIETIQSTLFPKGNLQERTLNVLSFLNLHGDHLLRDIKQLAGGDLEKGHYVVPL